jgi:hypothetical protein
MRGDQVNNDGRMLLLPFEVKFTTKLVYLYFPSRDALSPETLTPTSSIIFANFTEVSYGLVEIIRHCTLIGFCANRFVCFICVFNFVFLIILSRYPKPS